MKNRIPLFSSRFLLFPLLFLFGAVGYYLIEVAFRGYSHWSMALCGGICLCLIYLTNRRLSRRSLLLRALLGALIITAVEFVAGCILNLCLHWNIWDYSHLPLNLLGQITPVFSGIWFLLSIPVCVLSSFLNNRIAASSHYGRRSRRSVEHIN